MGSGRAQTVCDTLRKWFVTYGAPEELGSDGGPPFDSYDYDTFLSNWGIRKRLSSAYNPQSNGRAELAVKSAKRILSDNVDNSGRLDHDKVARVLLIHRNTPVADLNMSPAVMLYGRPIRDHLPALLTSHSIRPEWSDIRNLREAAFAKRHMRNENFYNHGTKQLAPLRVGDSVQVQNQHGSMPRRWHTTGKIVEVLDHQQYRVRVDGSNRITLRNRRFLRSILPVVDSHSSPPIPPTEISVDRNIAPEVSQHELNLPSTPSAPTPGSSSPVRVPSAPTLIPPASSPPLPAERPVQPAQQPTLPQRPQDPPSVESPPPAPRRSSRISRPKRDLSPVMRGKTHGYSDK